MRREPADDMDRVGGVPLFVLRSAFVVSAILALTLTLVCLGSAATEQLEPVYRCDADTCVEDFRNWSVRHPLLWAGAAFSGLATATFGLVLRRVGLVRRRAAARTPEAQEPRSF